MIAKPKTKPAKIYCWYWLLVLLSFWAWTIELLIFFCKELAFSSVVSPSVMSAEVTVNKWASFKRIVGEPLAFWISSCGDRLDSTAFSMRLVISSALLVAAIGSSDLLNSPTWNNSLPSRVTGAVFFSALKGGKTGESWIENFGRLTEKSGKLNPCCPRAGVAKTRQKERMNKNSSVSYTHLTLPTIYSV